MLRRKVVFLVITFIFIVWITVQQINNIWWLGYKAATYSSYLTRPLWDTRLKEELARWKITRFLGTEDEQNACKNHQFRNRATSQQHPIKFYDAFLFSSEIDLLEVRLNELAPVVEKFIIIESSCNFMGKQKELVFDKNKNRPEFAKFAGKIVHKVASCIVSVGFSAETTLRNQLIDLTRAAGARDGDLFHLSDLDELPRREVIDLLLKCDFGDRIHLALDSYRYSFEFRVWPEYVFRSHVSVLGGKFNDDQISTRFAYLTDKLLGGSGWHCSWCMRTLDDMMNKMKGYSHSDRTKFDPNSLNEKVLQERVCQGDDPFGFLPEAADYSSMASSWKLSPMLGAMNTPKYVRQHPGKFAFLLPGGCKNRTLQNQ